jgi:hypothetical protein
MTGTASRNGSCSIQSPVVPTGSAQEAGRTPTGFAGPDVAGTRLQRTTTPTWAATATVTAGRQRGDGRCPSGSSTRARNVSGMTIAPDRSDSQEAQALA